MSWRHSLIPQPLIHRLFPLLSPSPSDTPSASFYRLYQFLPQTRQSSSAMSPNTSGRGLSPRGHFQRSLTHTPIINPRQALLPTRTRHFNTPSWLDHVRSWEKAYNRPMRGLPRDAPPVVDDSEGLQARPKRPENVPAWAEAVIPLGEVMDVPDSEWNVPTDENADEDFLRLGVRVATPHWVFV